MSMKDVLKEAVAARDAIKQDLAAMKLDYSKIADDLRSARDAKKKVEAERDQLKVIVSNHKKNIDSLSNSKWKKSDEIDALKSTIGDLYAAARDLGYDYQSGFLGVEIPPDGADFDNGNVKVKLQIPISRIRAILERLQNDVSYGPSGRSYAYFRYTVQLNETLQGILTAASNYLKKAGK